MADPPFPRDAPVWFWSAEYGRWLPGRVTGTPQFPQLRAVRHDAGISTFPVWQLLDRPSRGQYPQGITPTPPDDDTTTEEN